MFRSRSRRLGVAAVVAAFALAGCGAAPEVTSAPGVAPKDCGTVRLAKNNWVGYEANLAVVTLIAREELGCKVEVKEEVEVESWESLARGEIDAILENWGHDDLRKKYIDEQKVVVEMGLTGNRGVLGWWVPPWMAEQYPDITDYRNLNKYAELFAAGDADRGTLLDGDPEFVTNDEALVRNLGLRYTVQYAGSEDALISAFRAAEKDKKPLLGYFYSPQWLLAEIDLKFVSLPPYTPGCDADPEKVACAYQPYDLDKVASREFAYSGNPAAELVKNFEWTDADQNSVARDIADRGLSPEAAAKRWLDANPETWQSWLPRP